MKYQGLTSEDVQKKQLQYGKNILPEEKSIPAIKLFVSQFANPLVYILCFAALISFFLQKYLDIALILAVVVANAIMGFFQENKTQKTLLALKKLIKPNAKVFRDNERQEIEASELVPGDIVFLGMGDKIPADGKVVEDVTFFVNEAVLTGESEAVKKKEGEDVFMGTIVSSGRAVIRVAQTGLKTKIGEIAQTLKETQQPATTLQIRLKKLTHTLIVVSIILAGLIFLFGLLTGREFLQMVELSAVILVAIIPEALLIVITLVLVLAMRDSLKRKAFDNNDYNAWKNLMNGKGRVTNVVNEGNFNRFAEAHRLMEAGKNDEANKIRQELGLGQGSKDGQGMNKGQNRGGNFVDANGDGKCDRM